MAEIVQGLLGQALSPDLSATSQVSTASQIAAQPLDFDSWMQGQGYDNILDWLNTQDDWTKKYGVTAHSYQLQYQNYLNQFKSGDQTVSKSTDITQDNFVDYMRILANKGNKDALDWLVNYYSTWEANKWAAQRDDTAYQRLDKDLKAAGISPYVLSGATPQISSVKMPGSSSFAETEKNKRSRDATDRGNVMQMIGYGLLTAGRIIAALI